LLSGGHESFIVVFGGLWGAMRKNNKKQLGLRHAALRKNLKNAADPSLSALQLAQFYENDNSSHCDIKKAVHYYKIFLQQNNVTDR
jgi:hypothetical protein